MADGTVTGLPPGKWRPPRRTGGATTGGGTGGPPTGPAGGDLAGSYPNPSIAGGAVGNAEISDVAWAKVTGAPAAFPPSGAAGGDLTGTYPAPTIGAGKVTRAKTAPDCWLSPVPVDPTNVGQVLTVAAGPTLAWQTPAVTEALSGVWNYKATGGMTDPGTGNLAPDVVGAPTVLRFSTYTVDGTDTRNIFLTTDVGDILVLQQKTDATKWGKFQVRAAVVDHGTWFEVPSTSLAGGTGGALANNADVAVQFQRGTGAAGPTGPAGGDLAGTYPNPTVAAGAVGNAEISDVAWGKVTGAPSAFPPSGAAGGDLAGTYPNPTLKAGAVNDADVTDVGWAKITGAPTSFPPSGAASGDLGGSYPGPTVAKLNGAAVGVTTPLARGDLLVADATPALKRLGLGTASQVLQSNGTDVVWGASLGGPPSGAASGDLQGTYPGPTIKPSALPWTVAGATLTPTDTTKKVSVPGPTATGADQSQMILGTRTGKARLYALPALDWVGLIKNAAYDGSAWAQDDVTKPSWHLALADTDQFQVNRSPAGSPTPVTLLRLDSAGKLTCTLADSTVTRPMLTANIVTNAVAVAIPANFSTTTYNNWVKVCDFPAITTRGGRVFLTAGLGLTHNCVSASGTKAIGIQFYRSGTPVAGGGWYAIGVNGGSPLPPLMAQDNPAAGTYTYSYYIYIEAGNSPSVSVHPNGGSWCWATEIP